MRLIVPLLALATTASAADWKLVGVDEDIRAYYHPTTLHRSDNRVRMWTLNDYKKGQKVEGKTVRSIKSQHEFDCTKKKTRMLFAAMHPHHMGKGIPVYAGLNPTEWQRVAPDSGEEYLLKFACAKKKSRTAK
jgi:hypothetical protein